MHLLLCNIWQTGQFWLIKPLLNFSSLPEAVFMKISCVLKCQKNKDLFAKFEDLLNFFDFLGIKSVHAYEIKHPMIFV